MTDIEVDEPADTDTPTTRPRRTVPVGAFVVALMVAVALGILAAVALATSDGGGDGELEEARFAAGRFAERFLSFDDEALDDWKADVLALSTGGFAEEVDDVEDGLRRLIAEAELDARAEVTDIFVGDIERGAVEAVVIYERELRSPTGARDETDRYMQLAMISVDGEWLVDNVIDIATVGLGPAEPGPGAPGDEADTTTTTSPGPTSSDTSEPTG